MIIVASYGVGSLGGTWYYVTAFIKYKAFHSIGDSSESVVRFGAVVPHRRTGSPRGSWYHVTAFAKCKVFHGAVLLYSTVWCASML